MKKKTALVYFLNGLIGLEKEYNIKLETVNKLHKLFFEAKELEKEQIIQAYFCGADEESDRHGAMYKSAEDAVKYYYSNFEQ
jgi:hypothetical protein